MRVNRNKIELLAVPGSFSSRAIPSISARSRPEPNVEKNLVSALFNGK